MRRIKILHLLMHFGYLRPYGVAREYTLIQRKRNTRKNTYYPVDAKDEKLILARLWLPFVDEDDADNYIEATLDAVDILHVVAHLERGNILPIDDIQVTSQELLEFYKHNQSQLTSV